MGHFTQESALKAPSMEDDTRYRPEALTDISPSSMHSAFMLRATPYAPHLCTLMSPPSASLFRPHGAELPYRPASRYQRRDLKISRLRNRGGLRLSTSFNEFRAAILMLHESCACRAPAVTFYIYPPEEPPETPYASFRAILMPITALPLMPSFAVFDYPTPRSLFPATYALMPIPAAADIARYSGYPRFADREGRVREAIIGARGIHVMTTGAAAPERSAFILGAIRARFAGAASLC